ncbi:complex I subunit 5 family protein [Nitrospira sp. Kam-Ns4a]
MTRHLPVLLFLTPFSTGVAMPAVALVRPTWCRPLALGALAVMCGVAGVGVSVVAQAGPVHYAFGGWAPPLGIEWVLDGLSAVVLLPISGIAFAAVWYGGPTLSQDLAEKTMPFHTLLLLLVAGLTGIVLAADLFNIFVFVEVTSLCAYALVGMAGAAALMAALRYLILGTLGASLYLLGVAYCYAATGTLNMADLAQRLPGLLESQAVLWGLVLMMVGLSIKMALVPLHGWLPDAYTHAPDAVSPLIAPLVTKVALYATVRILYWVAGVDLVRDHLPLLAYWGWLGAVATLVGALLALAQQNLKRMFAYAGVSHLGLVVLGISQGTPTGLAGGVFYLIVDAVMQAGLFFFAGAAIRQCGASELDALARMRGGMAWTRTLLVLTGVSMVGFPPTGGFFGKWYLVLGALEARNYAAVMVILVVTLVTLAYFAKVFARVFLEPAPAEAQPAAEVPWPMRLSMGIVIAGILGLGLFSDAIIGFLGDLVVPKGV